MECKKINFRLRQILVAGLFVAAFFGVSQTSAQTPSPDWIGASLSQNRSILSVSSVRDGSNPTWAVDGDIKSAWVSQKGENQWISVDLGEEIRVGEVKLFWQDNFATKYTVDLSLDGINWTTGYFVSDGKKEENLVVNRPGRYIKLNLEKGVNFDNYQLAELEAYRALSPTPTPTFAATPTFIPTATPTTAVTPTIPATPSPTNVPSFSRGDGDHDNRFTLKDLSILLSHYNRPGGFPKEVDLNNDGKIDGTDYQSLSDLIKKNKSLRLKVDN